jgi:quercetin dioxygenase-like cupin family protein
MPDCQFVISESDVAWDVDPDDEGLESRIRWRTIVTADRTPSSGLSMGVLEVPPASELRRHHHRPQEIYYVTAGAGEVFVDGQWRMVRAGDVVFHPSDSVHGARNRGDGSFTIAWVVPTDTYDEVFYIDD